MSEQALWALTNIVANEEFGGYGISHSAIISFSMEYGVYGLMTLFQAANKLHYKLLTCLS